MNGVEKRAMLDRGVLWCAIAAVVIYVIGDLVCGLLYNGYSFRDQAISELSAFGSPVRPLMVAIVLVHGVLLFGLGIAIFRAAASNMLQWLGALLMAIGLVGFPTHTVWAMTSRRLAVGFNDTMHIAMTMVFSMLAAAAIVLSGVAFRGWFRVFAAVVLLLLIGFGVAASLEMRGLETNHTPWAGALERTNAYVYFAWLIVLAVNFERGGAAARGPR